MSAFPGAHAQVYYNEAGEPMGWDYPPDEEYDPCYEDEYVSEWAEHNPPEYDPDDDEYELRRLDDEEDE